MSRSTISLIIALAVVMGFAIAGFAIVGAGVSYRKIAVLVIAVAVLTAAILGVVMWTGRSARSKSQRTVARELDAQRLGLDYKGAGDKAFRARFADLSAVPRSAKIKHIHEGSIDGRPVIVFESSYVVSTGQTTIQVSHTIYAVEIPEWPATHVTPRSWFWRLVRKLGRRSGLELDDPEFNHRFKVKAEDEDFAIALLSPDMQAFMLTKTSVSWRIKPGRLCMLYSGTLKTDRMEASLQRLQGFLALIPQELDAW